MAQEERVQKTNGGFIDWFLGVSYSLEDEERRAREERVQDLLPREDEMLGRAYDPRLIRRLGGYIRPYQRQFAWAILLMVLRSLFSAAGPWIVGQAVDLGIRLGDMSALRLWTLIFIAIALAEWATNRWRVMILAYVGTRVVADVRSALFHHLHRLSLSFYNNYSVGRLMSRLISDVQALQGFITWSITGVFRAVFTLLGIVVAMFAMNWRLALVALAVLPLMVWLTRYWSNRVRDTYRATRQRISLINGYLNESVSGIRVTKSFGREAYNLGHFDDLNQSYFEANVRASLLAALYFPGIDLLASLAAALVVGVGGMLVLRETLTAGTLVAFMLYAERFFEPVRELADRYNSFQAAMASSERLFALLDNEPMLQDAADAYPLPPIRGTVDFQRVTFGYEDGEPVLCDVDIHAEPGQRIALVGETGAGKTTLVKLLARFFDVDEGAVRVDGHDVRAVTAASLRSQLGIVSQDTFLFGGTVADNIRYGKLDASDEEVVAAAQAVGAHDFIVRMAGGYEAEVGENGVNLSVGQRQILACARALLADPRILVLDEATSSVDTTTEKQIQHAFEQLMAGRTSFVIAHRLNTVVNADQIVVIEDGRVVELGTHEELLARHGRYRELYALQWAQK
ncbi:MAG: ABC transporter ATP-binding protein [Anaerolineae bacterium]|nr:ABC transporter ATP-binding protein [Anaerolineae bacterium]